MKRVLRRQRGAALLAAMLTVALVATFAAAAVWQQWRATEVEAAERVRVQTAWILIGALDWSRLILREDGIAGNTDHLAEPWAVPLQESRLSTFLAADRSMADASASTADAQEAFLSGRIVDAQSKLNLSNLVGHDRKIDAATLAQFTRLFALLGLPASQLTSLAQNLLLASDGSASGAPLMPQKLQDLGWLGLPPATIAALAPYATVLPARTTVNVNTAGAEVLYASAPKLQIAQARQFVGLRDTVQFDTLLAAGKRLGDESLFTQGAHDVRSNYFEVQGRLRIDQFAVEEHSLVFRTGIVVRTIWRERGPAPADE
ncbi:type II secretion system minor pseudopilin GspK [Xylophilus sp.]|uniref:type II secretion system minor pseudopilin GspK n=1 Tax=Xylophilus sp. TaxID=2653893 RepID=UPI0013BC0246|nr:type II secretion system minor pseudopilin GspK [Xylophilus sp.]KAF1049816.1 MAG: hypothetical protein GAK38_00479 [Xylophilus sp.]